jgi:hypothetical protein
VPKVDEEVRTLLNRVGELQLERRRLEDDGASHEQLDRNCAELTRAWNELAAALGAGAVFVARAA